MVSQHQFGSQSSPVRLRRTERIFLAAIGIGVIFAALGAGEAVYRLAFLQFDGAVDRLPIEVAFGLGFAWLTIRLMGQFYRERTDTSVRMNLVWHRSRKIRHAVETIAPLAIPANQQAVRVIREEVDRIESALSDALLR
ncbi:MAG TPA: hypothetical protein VKV05_13855 [Terriglobales bacterium]|nr:hypothetical protein [Terriglobales bacterium]